MSNAAPGSPRLADRAGAPRASASADAGTALRRLWLESGGAPEALERASISLAAPLLPSIYRVATAAPACVAASALAAAEVWRLRTGRAQAVRVDSRAAEIAYRSERYLRLDGEVPDRDTLGSVYHRARDGRFVQLHLAYPHHRARIAAVLGADPLDRDAVAGAVARRGAFELEHAVIDAGACAYVLRAGEAWAATAPAAAVAGLPLVEIERVGDAPPVALEPARRPLSGVRVLDLTRVIAGPIAGRTLAEHGAEVLRISPPDLGEVPVLVMDGGRGKRSAVVDLRAEAGRAAFERLLDRADVVVQGYRPGALDALGYAPAALAARRPGSVHVSLSAWGRAGPWAERRGFDSLVQTATGIAEAGGRAAGRDGPLPLPCQALDHSTGYLAAFGAAMALARRAREGGSWHVRVSLARTGRWLESLGRADALDVPDPGLEDVRDRLEEGDTPFGRMTWVRPAAELDATPARWERPAVPIGSDPPEWL